MSWTDQILSSVVIVIPLTLSCAGEADTRRDADAGKGARRLTHQSSPDAGTESPVDSPPPSTASLGADDLCDGSEDVTLSLKLVERTSKTPLDDFVQPDGIRSLYVTGKCEFWVNDSSWFTYHDRLSESAKRRVMGQLEFERLPAASGDWAAATGCFDPPLVSVTHREYTVNCECECPDAPAEAQNIYANYWELIQSLVEEADRWTGPLRVLVIEQSSLDDQELQQWPLKTDISDLVVPRNDLNAGRAAGKLIDDPETISAIRSLRREFVGSKGDPDPLTALPIESNGVVYGLYTVDILPFGS